MTPNPLRPTPRVDACDCCWTKRWRHGSIGEERDRLMNLQIDLAAVREVAARHDLRLVVVFGSHVKGRGDNRSDLDLAALATRRRWDDLDWELGLEADLSFACGDREVDLVLLNGASPLLQFEVARSGQALYEKEPGAFSRFRSYAARLYYDNEVRFRRQAEYLARVRG
jgi:predicted nucleotidyltransferase